MYRRLALLFGAACLTGCGQSTADTVGEASINGAASDQSTSIASGGSAPSESTTAPTEVMATTSTPPTTPVVETSEPTSDGQLHAEPVETQNGTICAEVSLDGVHGRFCSLRTNFIWSLGDRVFLFYVGPDVQLRDGRVLVRKDGEKFVVSEIRDETTDNPPGLEPGFCSVILIAEAFGRYAPTESYGWGGGSCTSEEIFGVGTIPGVDEFGISEVLGGADGTDRYVGFVARLDGVWTVLELVPGDQMLGCESVTVPIARAVCDHSFSFKDVPSTEP